MTAKAQVEIASLYQARDGIIFQAT